MVSRIVIKAGSLVQEAELLETRTAAAIADVLPITGTANTWGDEIYFRIPVDMNAEDPKEVVQAGDLGYWPPGKAFCIFFGPTPSSRGDEIRPASPVNVFGRLLGDPREFKKVRDGETLTIEAAAE